MTVLMITVCQGVSCKYPDRYFHGCFKNPTGSLSLDGQRALSLLADLLKVVCAKVQLL